MAATGTRVLLLRATRRLNYEEIRTRALERFRTAVPSAEVIELPAGHTLLTDAGPEVRRILLDWLGRSA